LRSLPPYSLCDGWFDMSSLKRLLLLVSLAFVLAGCAKLPSGAAVPTTKRLVFRFTMQNPVNPAFFYYVALRPSTVENPPDQGPVPVVAPPWGNGIVAGNVNYFVQWSANNPPSSRYMIYQFADANLINYFAIGVPINFIDVSGDGRTLQFELDLAQIAPSIDVANSYQSIQVNFLTQDNIPQGNSGSKNWDALGDSRSALQINSPITIPLRTSGTYTNTTFHNLEPSGDVVEPSLDIVDFSVEVRAQ
jgi:hypothetical protein